MLGTRYGYFDHCYSSLQINRCSSCLGSNGAFRFNLSPRIWAKSVGLCSTFGHVDLPFKLICNFCFAFVSKCPSSNLNSTMLISKHWDCFLFLLALCKEHPMGNPTSCSNCQHYMLDPVLDGLWLGPSHLMFSFLLQILKLGGGHFSLFIIHYFCLDQNVR